MDSRLHGVPLSTTQMAPKIPVSSSLSGIRAPLTMDDSDFEYSTSAKSHKNSSVSSYNSGSETEYEEFVIGEDEFESASERHFGTDPDEVVREETYFVNEYEFSRPVVKSPGEEIVRSSDVSDYTFSRLFVKNPDGEIVRGSDDFNEFAFSRPFVKIADEEVIEERNSGNEYDDYRPFVKSSDDEIIEEMISVNEFDDYKSLLNDRDKAIMKDKVNVAVHGDSISSFSVVNTDEDILENDPTPVVDIGISVLPKMVMPIALVSGDSDDDSPHSEAMEDDVFSAVIRVPSAEMLQRVDGAPKVRILDVEEEESDESESHYLVEPEIVEDLAPKNVLNGVSSSKYEEETDESQSHRVVEPEFLEDLDPNNISNGVSSSNYEDEGDKSKPHEAVKPEFVEYSASNNILNGFSNSKDEGCRFWEDTVHKGADSIEEGKSRSFLESKECNSSKESSDKDAMQLNEEIYSIDEKKCVNSDHSRMSNDLTSCGNEETKDVESLGTNAFHTLEVDRTLPHETMSLLDMDEVVSLDDGSCKNSNIDVAKNVVLTRSDATESRCKQNVNWTMASRDYITPRKNESANDAAVIDELLTARELVSSFHGHSVYFSRGGAIDDESVVSDSPDTHVSLSSSLERQIKHEGDNGAIEFLGEVDNSLLRDENKRAVVTEHRLPSTSVAGGRSSRDQSEEIDRQVMTVSDEEVNSDREIDGRQILDSAGLAAVLKAGTGASSDSGSINFSSVDGTEVFSLERPANLEDFILDSRKNNNQLSNHSFLRHSEATMGSDSEESPIEEEMEKIEKLQLMRERYLRLVHRLGRSPDDRVVAQVLNQLALAAGRPSAQGFSLECAKARAVELEQQIESHLSFSLNILVIGKTGVGKSATINSIFGEKKVLIDAFEPATMDVKEIIGSLNGVKIRILDTPGLRTSFTEQSINRRILLSIKKFMRKCPPDVVLYVDRVDAQTRDLTDLPILKSITTYLGSSIWHNVIIALTHAASTLPDGPSGNPLSYDAFVAQQSRVVQQLINHSAGDMHVMKPVAFVENHHSVEKNKDGETMLPNGEIWRSQLLLLCYSMKILSEVNSVIKNHDPLDHTNLFGFRIRSPSLPYFLSSLLQSNDHPKLSNGGENDSDIELEYSFDSDKDDDYDKLPLFKPLNKFQFAKLSREQRKSYFEEYDYRVKLLQKKQWREEIKRLRDMKKKGKDGLLDHVFMDEDVNDEAGTTAAVAVPLPDLVLPPSFDGDNLSFRYRFLESSSHLLTRPVTPVFDSQGWEWDHPIGNDQSSIGLSLMRWRGDLIWGCNLQSQLSIYQDSKLNVQDQLNNKLNGQISVRISSSEQLQVAFLSLLPVAEAIFRKVFSQSIEN
ncbi:translocase of chloroplast 159, chloroplastic-like [Olea europaea var. sylvestris]|uniref:translocase of chloroplast 159, chloroplastic-like n=1 Tax=Olea europaea var. sylvestris TaxID=158386 RepID=UPI000C1D4106|nr:translocase of chloroplast 159, chloroplastic-like [Olea europaea var. sylvestris]